MKIAVIGFGNMGQAITQGWITGKVLNPEQILCTAANYGKLMENCEKFGTVPMETNGEAIANADIVLLAVKPAMIEDALKGCKDLLAGKIVICIAAGVPFDVLEKIIPNTRHISMIPNTPIEIGQGIVVAQKENSLTQDDLAQFELLFAPIALIVSVDAAHLSIAGTIAGCAPAFTEMYVEALGDAGVKYGLTRKMSYELAAKMIEGVGALYLANKDHPGAMKDAVCSPGGTTIKGVSSLEKNGFRGAVIDAVDAIEGSSNG